MNVDGVAAEIAVAKALEVPYNGGVPYKADDVAGCEVKQTVREDGNLLIPPFDPKSRRAQIPDETPVVLVTGSLLSKGPFNIRGWIDAGTGRKVGKLGAWGNPNRPPIYGVAQRQLMRIETLRGVVNGR